jgi:uncharacterized membrane-anchored protein YhcB (DUF1043 family)
MSLERFEKNRGRRSIIGAFSIGALVIGFLTLNLIPEDFLIYYLILTFIVGAIIGLIVVRLFDNKKPIENWYEPEFRSKEYDSVYRAHENQKPNKDLISLFKELSDSELITTMRLRYYNLTDQTESELIKEIKFRNILPETISRHYNDKIYYKFKSSRQCPCCGDSKYVYKEAEKVKKCMICGFDREFENPDSLATKIRWTLGVYYASKLSENDFLKMLIDE